VPGSDCPPATSSTPPVTHAAEPYDIFGVGTRLVIYAINLDRHP
jgi:hypothetical protein